MKLQLRRRYVAGISLALVAVIATSGAVFAYWTAGGSGSDTAAAGTTQELTVNQTVDISGMYPGQTVDLEGNFDNPNPGSIYVKTVTATLGAVTGADGTCVAADNFTITGTATVNAEVPTGDGVGAWSGLSLTFLDLATDQNGCKNGTVTINYATGL